MNYINGRLTGVASANELEQEIEELRNLKQDLLISGGNIKTINNQSVLGDGNIQVGNAGTVTAITAGNGLKGGTITASGTISVDTDVIATKTYIPEYLKSIEGYNAEASQVLKNDHGTLKWVTEA